MNYQCPLELSNTPDNTFTVNASVIWLHGLGADGYDFEPIVTYLLSSDELKHVRFILPHAPDIPVTRNDGYIMPAWYDVYGITPTSKEDAEGISASQRYIKQLIENEIQRGIPCERIVLAGFSQGGAIALHTALRFPKRLAAVLALSTYLPLQSRLSTEQHIANGDTPIFMAHGVHDNIISLEMAKASLDVLISHQHPVIWHEYAMAHSVSNEEVADIKRFLKQVLR